MMTVIQDMLILARCRYLLAIGICSLAASLLCASLGQTDNETEQNCLRCHKDPTLKQALPDGQVRSLFVDPAEWHRDVHRENGLRCIDCHSDATSVSHPVGGFESTACASCHSEDCEEFARTVHALQYGTEPIPACHDCHTKHNVRRKDDPEASVSDKQVASVCSPCHQVESASKTLFHKLVFFRVSGHKKENISGRYDNSRCINCHFQDGAHGQPGILAEQCATCHRKGGWGSSVFSRSGHAATILGRSGFVSELRVLYGLFFIIVFGGVAILFVRKGKKVDMKDSSS